jgi:outer membrane receptor protein involved in Fe transport
MAPGRTSRIRIIGLAALLGSTSLGGAPALAQQAAATVDASADDTGEIIVTAQKREENLQRVPLSIQAFGTEKLDQLQVQKFDDYARFLPSVSFETAGPGSARVYMRGIANGENGNHSAQLPSVGVYLDEQPITTITGPLDLHIYDVARVEALAGPQGTLYGASSQSGTLRIITNKPDVGGGFYGGADAEVNHTAHGEFGYTLEGFANAPIADNAAVRLVGWYDEDGGYIDNVAGTRTFAAARDAATANGQNSGFATANNARFVEEDYNDVRTYGGRAALQIDLDENWTLTPQFMAQKQDSDGSFAQESGRGKWRTEQYNPEFARDKWFQAALTVQGKIGNWDLTYSGAYLKRRFESASDYSDYSYFYDALYGSVFYDNAGNVINPNQYIESDGRFAKQSHELRLASPGDAPLRFIGGLFYQRQRHGIEENYLIDNLETDLVVPGTRSNIWLTKQTRIDRDYAAFGELTYDITEKLKVTGGARLFRYDNTLVGYFGFASNQSRCNYAGGRLPAVVPGTPCTNLADEASTPTNVIPKASKKTDVTYKANITYQIDDNKLVYATYSRGFRPGGVNRRATLPPYDPDFIDNYEIGWKTTFLDRAVRWNGAIYQLDWTDIQLSFLGQNGLTEIQNAGNARVRGVETDLSIRAAEGLTLSTAASYNDAELTRDYCELADETVPACTGVNLLARKGSRLPVSAKFKGNALARYEFPVGDLTAHAQGAVLYTGGRAGDLRQSVRGIVGDYPSYTTVDLSFGLRSDAWSAELYVTNLFDVAGVTSRGIQCVETTCGDPDGVTTRGGIFYNYVTPPRIVGLKVGTKF